MTKRALCLSGGGSKGAYQVGAIQALLEAGHQWDSIYGISVGALNAAWLAMSPPEEQAANHAGLRAIWDGVKTSRDIYEPWAPLKLNYLASLWKGSLNSGKPLRGLVEKFFDLQKVRGTGVKLSVGCCSLSTSRYQAFDQTNDKIMEYVLASSHLPVVFEPLEVDGELWIDGGVRHQIPILDALKDDPEEIDVIITQPITNYESSALPLSGLKSAIQVSLRGASIFSDQVYFEDCMNVLRIIKGEGKKNNVKHVNFFVPSRMPNEDSMNFDGNMIQRLIKMGYEETKAKLEEILAARAALANPAESL